MFPPLPGCKSDDPGNLFEFFNGGLAFNTFEAVKLNPDSWVLSKMPDRNGWDSIGPETSCWFVGGIEAPNVSVFYIVSVENNKEVNKNLKHKITENKILKWK